MSAISVAVFGLGILNVAGTARVLRRLRPLQRVVELGGQLPNPALPRIGDRVGTFESPRGDGTLVSDLSIRTGTVIVGFFDPVCLRCQAERAALLARPPAVPVVAFVHRDQSDDDHGKADALVQLLAPLGSASFVNESVNSAFGMRVDTGYPTFIRVERGTIAASSHTARDVLEVS